MDSPREAAIGFEAVKVSMSQTKDGLKMTLAIHPNDNVNDLFTHPVGSRYQVALVLLDDENQPVVPPRKTAGQRAVTAAAMLPKEAAFCKWLYVEGNILSPIEDDAIAYIHEHCGIESRSELKDNDQARRRFEELQLSFTTFMNKDMP